MLPNSHFYPAIFLEDAVGGFLKAFGFGTAVNKRLQHITLIVNDSPFLLGVLSFQYSAIIVKV